MKSILYKFVWRNHQIGSWFWWTCTKNRWRRWRTVIKSSFDLNSDIIILNFLFGDFWLWKVKLKTSQRPCSIHESVNWLWKSIDTSCFEVVNVELMFGFDGLVWYRYWGSFVFGSMSMDVGFIFNGRLFDNRSCVWLHKSEARWMKNEIDYVLVY